MTSHIFNTPPLRGKSFIPTKRKYSVLEIELFEHELQALTWEMNPSSRSKSWGKLFTDTIREVNILYKCKQRGE